MPDKFPRRLCGALFLLTLLLLSPSGVTQSMAPVHAPILVFVGDILLAGKIERIITTAGPAAPFAGVARFLQTADFAAGNLECSLSKRGKPFDKTYAFRGRPENAEALRQAGIQLVTLANNHAGDYGRRALLDTLEACHDHGIITVGAGRTLADARQPVFSIVGEPKQVVAILAYSNMFPKEFYAGAATPGTNPARLASVEREVKAVRSRADIVIVIFHFGNELIEKPTTAQRALAHTAALAGADLVIGHHPHVLQGVERYGHGLIAYSLGNFVFSSKSAATRDTVMLSYTHTLDGRSHVTLTPCRITGGKPFLAKPKDRARIIKHLQSLSQELGTTLSEEGTVEW